MANFRNLLCKQRHLGQPDMKSSKNIHVHTCAVTHLHAHIRKCATHIRNSTQVKLYAKTHRGFEEIDVDMAVVCEIHIHALVP